MAGILIKIIAILVPIIFIVGGIVLIIQAAAFWIDITGPVRVQPVELSSPMELPFTVQVFVPEKIRPEDPPLGVEVQVKTRATIENDTEVRVDLIPQCDYLGVVPASMLIFGPKHQPMQSAVPKLNVRNMPPPPDCLITVQVFYGSISTPLTADFRITVDAWTGRLLAMAKLLFGFVGVLVGLRNVIRVAL